MTTSLVQAPPVQTDTYPDYTIVPAPDRPWTREDLLALDTDHRYELVRGELRQMRPASFRHDKYEARLIIAIGISLRDQPALGDVVPGDTGFELQAAPLTIRGPDLAFVRTERLQPESEKAFPALAPDLVVEIISPSETAHTIADKVSDYLQAGTRLLWLVYPERQEVQEYYQGNLFHIYRHDDTLDGRDVLPGFQYALSELFT